VRDPAKAQRLFPEGGPTLVQADLADAGALRRACAGLEAVVHLAGVTAARDRDQLFEVNAGRTRALVQAVRVPGVAGVIVGTVDVQHWKDDCSAVERALAGRSREAG